MINAMGWSIRVAVFEGVFVAFYRGSVDGTKEPLIP